MLKGKKIVIGITGSIAAFKIPFLVRLLKKEGAEVQVLMTPAACDFVTPLTLSTLTERPVLTSFFKKEDGSWFSHVNLGLWADLLLIAPLSANTLAKMANGIADNLLLTTILSARCPVYFAPAMDMDMYGHPTTQENIRKLLSFGYRIIKPVEGELASGLSGPGRLEEPEQVFEIMKKALTPDTVFSGKKVLVTAGPTYEPIDPVRFIGNHSSGRMGTEIALALAHKGAAVELITGPSAIELEHPCINLTRINTAEEMYTHSTQLFPDCQLAIMTAAVADFAPLKPAEQKIKKENRPDAIHLQATKDILAALGKMKAKGQLLVGFALETEDEGANALKKLKSKNLDLIVLNSLNDEGAGFGGQSNKVSLLFKSGEKIDYPLKSKTAVAEDILAAIEEKLSI
ncbi:MAG: bifunctional phosphopantothenoylcysteine decarboxylase/phosphopantothenate--cysteine ligase CoaBC [Bacteroidales bacterium]|nr:bifunctional phosphopantothenoylcysteine decarboxylase/phosphopantothenate--cysteine ligase CoaBC [Bacteroidales bacterium]